MLRDLQNRGFEAPLLAIGDGALGFWKALREIWPKAAEQRCWVHRTANVLDKLPKRLQPRAKKHLHEIFQAETNGIESAFATARLRQRVTKGAGTRTPAA